MAGEEEEARKLIESIRWPAGPVCVHCGGADRVYRMPSRPGLWKCGQCRRQFTVAVNTIFEETRLGLSKWLRAIKLLCGAPDGVTARQLAEELSVSSKTGLSILRKAGYAATQSPEGLPPRNSILGGAVYNSRESLHPLSFGAAVGLLLRVRPARKHPDALERRVAEMEAARRRRESASGQK